MRNSLKSTTKEFDLISISHYFYPRVGGLENMAFNLVSGLTKKGLKSLTIYGSNKRYSTTINNFQAESFKVFNLFDGTYPLFGLRFVTYVFNTIRENPNAQVVIHSRHLLSSLITSVICIVLSHQYTVIEHNAGPIYFKSRLVGTLASFLDKYLFSLVHKFASRIISVSETGKTWVSNTFRIQKNNIQTIYNGYNPKEIRNSFSKKENIVVWAAKWIEVKDPTTALRGFIKIAKRYPNWKFILIGQGDSLKKFPNIPKNVEVIPKFIKQEDLFRLLRKSKVYVNSSLSEGFALGILEATAFGNLPVLSNAPSNREVAKLLDTEKYIFTRKNSSDLVRKLDTAIQDSKQKKIFQNLSSTTKSFFSNNSMIDNYYAYLFPKYLASNNIQTLSIVIPTFNEEDSILRLLDKVVAIKLPNSISKEIILVDDCSTDNTSALIKEYLKRSFDNVKFKSLKNESNLGKSQTVKHGVLHSTGDLVVVQDADLEYTPEELVSFVDTFLKYPNTDVIYGNRFNDKNIFINPIHYLGNKFLTSVSNLFTFPNGFGVKDMETCYKMTRGDLFRDIFLSLESNTSFGLEPEVTAKLASREAKVRNMDISYKPRFQSEGKKMNWYKHGLEAINEIIRFNTPRRKFRFFSILFSSKNQ
ncbi:glycosyltransferase [bacterium]|nr:glycosyltransferase [bacterium]